MMLQALGLGGRRVLLLHPPGLDYVAGFLGCLYAAAVAVPAYPPRKQRSLDRLRAIAMDPRACGRLPPARHTRCWRFRPLKIPALEHNPPFRISDC
jgi:hypothetical protein